MTFAAFSFPVRCPIENVTFPNCARRRSQCVRTSGAPSGGYVKKEGPTVPKNKFAGVPPCHEVIGGCMISFFGTPLGIRTQKPETKATRLCRRISSSLPRRSVRSTVKPPRGPAKVHLVGVSDDVDCRESLHSKVLHYTCTTLTA